MVVKKSSGFREALRVMIIIMKVVRFVVSGRGWRKTIAVRVPNAAYKAIMRGEARARRRE